MTDSANTQLINRPKAIDSIGDIAFLKLSFYSSKKQENVIYINSKLYEKYLIRSMIMKLVKKVRKAIADIGGTMPEYLPTPKKSLKELDKYNDEIIEK